MYAIYILYVTMPRQAAVSTCHGHRPGSQVSLPSRELRSLYYLLCLCVLCLRVSVWAGVGGCWGWPWWSRDVHVSEISISGRLYACTRPLCVCLLSLLVASCKVFILL